MSAPKSINYILELIDVGISWNLSFEYIWVEKCMEEVWGVFCLVFSRICFLRCELIDVGKWGWKVKE